MSFDHLKDEEVVLELQELMKNGEAESPIARQYANLLFKRYYRHVVNFCRYYGLSRENAEDVAQDSYVRMYKYLLTFKGEKKFKPWFFTLVFNQVRGKHNEIKKNSFKDLDSIVDLPAENYENISENLQIRGVIQDIINRMPEKLKQVIVMRLFSRMNFEEIGISMGVSSRQIRTRMNQAMAFMKNELGDVYEI